LMKNADSLQESRSGGLPALNGLVFRL
jgi:hypothetical protein